MSVHSNDQTPDVFGSGPVFGQLPDESAVGPVFGQVPAVGQQSSGQPTVGHPAYGQPTSAQGPSFGALPTTYGEQVSQPAFEQPAYGQQASIQPTYGQPTYGQQASIQPTYGQPTYGQQTPVQGPAFADVPLRRQGKSWVSAVLLSLFLGPFGGVDFYLGYTKMGWSKLILFGLQSLAELIGYGKQFVTQISTGQPVELTDSLPSIWPLGVVSGVSRLVLAVWMVATIALVVTRKGSYATDVNGVPLR